MTYAIVLAALAVALISFTTGALMRRNANRLNLIDIPGGHKEHASPVPLGGGLGMYLGLSLVLCGGFLGHRLLGNSLAGALGYSEFAGGIAAKTTQALCILYAGGVLCLVGLIDDRKALGPWGKLLVQLFCAAIVVLWCKVRILTLAGDVASVTLTILWIVGLTNSFNFLDNMDGLAGGVGLICALALAAVAAVTGQWFVLAMTGLLVGALVGFLPHNIAPARLYMGDAGSLMMGFWLACCSCLVTYTPSAGSLAVGWLIPLCVMAVPIYDTLSVFYLRIRRGESIMVGDRRHFSHRLLKRGLSVRQAVTTICLATAICCGGAVILVCAGSVTVAVIVGIQIVAVLVLIGMLEAIWKMMD